jgi:hypothetical protein
MEFKWPVKGKKLFIDSGNLSEFSHFGWGDTETQFLGYMEGYKVAADTLIDTAINLGTPKDLDILIFPTCFLYRQYLELVMKTILIFYSGHDRKVASDNVKKVQHDLLKTWNVIEEYMLEEASDDEKASIHISKGYIAQFHAIDKSSFTFRYPVDKDLNGVLRKYQNVNLINLKECMHEIYCFFSGVMGKLDQIKEWKADMKSYYEDYSEYYEDMSDYYDIPTDEW